MFRPLARDDGEWESMDAYRASFAYLDAAIETRETVGLILDTMPLEHTDLVIDGNVYPARAYAMVQTERPADATLPGEIVTLQRLFAEIEEGPQIGTLLIVQNFIHVRGDEVHSDVLMWQLSPENWVGCFSESDSFTRSIYRSYAPDHLPNIQSLEGEERIVFTTNGCWPEVFKDPNTGGIIEPALSIRDLHRFASCAEQMSYQ